MWIRTVYKCKKRERERGGGGLGVTITARKRPSKLMFTMKGLGHTLPDLLAVIHIQFLAYGSWDSLFPISMSLNCKLMSPDHYFS